MNTLQKSSYFTKVEDKYVFRISTAFWHLLIGLLSLAAIVGVVTLLWSLIPPSKDQVKVVQYPAQPIYPPVDKVNFSDLHLVEEKSQPAVDINPVLPPAQKQEVQVIEENDLDKPAYDVALADLRKIIGEEQWKPGTWIVTNQTGWELYHSDQYRAWQPTGMSIEDYLNNIYRIVKTNKFAEKRKALDAITKIAKAASKDGKGKSIEYIYSSVNSNWANMKLFDSVCTLISENLKVINEKNSTTALQNIIQFSYSNPRDAFDFIPFATKTCNQIPDSLRASVLRTLIISYYNYFSGNIPIQKDATKQFIELLPQLRGFDLATAMRKYYLVYNQKNSQRSVDIERMNNQYAAQVNAIVMDSVNQAMQNEYIYREKQDKKTNLRSKSFLAIGGGFVAIALLGTILTLLSIQRILKKIVVVAEGKNTFP